MEILAQSSTAFVLTHNFQGTHILGASRGRLSDSVASCLSGELLAERCRTDDLMPSIRPLPSSKPCRPKSSGAERYLSLSARWILDDQEVSANQVVVAERRRRHGGGPPPLDLTKTRATSRTDMIIFGNFLFS